MRILVIDNNKFPVDFNCEIESFQPDIDTADYDSFVAEELSDTFKNKVYDCVVLPFSLSKDNYSDYTGLRVALHIRYTKQWNHQRIPILFVGPDPVNQVAKFSEYGSFLFTPLVFTSNANTNDDLRKEVAKIEEILLLRASDKSDISSGFMTEQEFETFTRRIVITPPANYGTHHSIANEWAVLRWIEDIKWKKDVPSIDEKVAREFRNMLYFKYLEAIAVLDKNSKQKYDYKIDGIEKSRIALIDDEWEKGWYSLLSQIFNDSNAKLECYNVSFKGKSKIDLIEGIFSWIDKIGEINCYLLDLRLCDEDFLEHPISHEVKYKDTEFTFNLKDYSGHIIAKYINYKNRANQVIFFTASNKSWNLQKSVNECKASSYIIKESPEYRYTIKDSKNNYELFQRGIVNSIRNSYLKDFVSRVDKLPLDKEANPVMNSFIDLSLLQQEKDTLRAKMISCCALIEHKTRTIDVQTGVLTNKKGKEVKIINGLKSCLWVKKDSENHDTLIDVFYSKELISKHDINTNSLYIEYKDYEMASLSKKVNVTQIVAVLLFYYEISIELCKNVVGLYYERNVNAVHGCGIINKKRVSDDSLKKIFDQVILPIYE